MPSPDDLLTIVELRPLMQPPLSDHFIRRFLRQYGAKLAERKTVVKRSTFDAWLAGKLPPLPPPREQPEEQKREEQQVP